MSDIAMNRRKLLTQALILIGATGSVGVIAKTLIDNASGEDANLSADVLGLLGAVADTILPQTDTPGAVAAGVPKLFVAMLKNWASDERRTELLGALSDIDTESAKQKGKVFAALDAKARYALLSAYDAAALKQVPDTRNLKGIAALMAGPSVANPGYAKLRELIILLYYYSEAALTTELPYEHNPGGWTPSIKVTPETRAPGGIGMF